MTPASTQTKRIDPGWDGLGAQDSRRTLPDEALVAQAWAAIEAHFPVQPCYERHMTEEDRLGFVQAAGDALEV